MSGPIVRKYGFPNFEKIFGDRPLQHGVEDDTNGTAEYATETKKPAEPARAEAHASAATPAPSAVHLADASEDSQPTLDESKPAAKAKPKAAKAPKAEGTAKPKASKKK